MSADQRFRATSTTTQPTGVRATDAWLSTLPADTPIAELVHLAELRWCIEHNHRELEVALGLDHFEGRSSLGWHHLATLVTAAHPFLTTLRLTDPKACGQAFPSTASSATPNTHSTSG